MSQKKVDVYKSKKANRAKIAKREKIQYMVETGIGVVIACAIVVWMGFSVYDKVATRPEEDTAVTQTVIDTTAVEDYIADLNAETAE